MIVCFLFATVVIEESQGCCCTLIFGWQRCGCNLAGCNCDTGPNGGCMYAPWIGGYCEEWSEKCEDRELA